MLFLDGEAVFGNRLPEESLREFENEGARRAFETKYGEVSKSQWAGIKAAAALIQAMERPTLHHLKSYSAWQGVSGTFAEEEMIAGWLRVFKSPNARKPIEDVLAMLRKDRSRRASEERSKLANRTGKAETMVALTEFLFQINRLIRKARFVIFIDRLQKRPLPGLYCPNTGTGLAAMLFDRIPTPGGLGICQRPACQKSFFRIRAGQQYCSLRCGNADRKARERTRRARR